MVDAHERPDVAAHTIVYYDPCGNDATCACGAVLSIYGRATNWASELGAHIRTATARLAAVQAIRDQQPPRDLTPAERRGWDLAMEQVDAAMGAS